MFSFYRLSGTLFFFFFKQKTAYEMLRSLVGSEMCIRDRHLSGFHSSKQAARSLASSSPLHTLSHEKALWLHPTLEALVRASSSQSHHPEAPSGTISLHRLFNFGSSGPSGEHLPVCCHPPLHCPPGGGEGCPPGAGAFSCFCHCS
eukprot:TRINITY_DN63589_c0_g1_i1.p1 TRINITY_DN63589_c0_g1~~TRINITY_DN63589_c0_g1_i1.p1  ORF type:complete len:146 (+),score=21.19 TRINITY_DN63589_c0_g1_i1:44-481(+)